MAESIKIKDTINLPKTDFPMKAELAKKEVEFLKFWEENKIYEKILNKKDKNKKFILHDGPPYANGHIHIGHALNKILKDIIIKYKTMKGFYSPYIPGWDCHGLPIEHKVCTENYEKIKNMSKLEIRRECRKYASNFVEIQKQEFKRLGVLGLWNEPYLTMNYEYEATILECLKKLIEDGYVYRDLKPIHWCMSCSTALAEAEVEYENHSSDSIYVRFKLTEQSIKKLNIDKDTYIVIWTTTPWTLPANVGIAVHPQEDYLIVKNNGSNLIIAEKLVSQIKEIINIEPTDKKIKGSELENLEANHPFIDRISKIINENFVAMDTGTGCVHIAPGHGLEDYYAGIRYNLPIISPVDNYGKFTDEFALMKGENVFNANKKIIELLQNRGDLLYKGEIEHSYPHCWRCKKPVIFRATYQWFISMQHNNLRKNALESLENIKFTPYWGINRLRGMLENRPDWCLSRQRAWGVPIPVFYCMDCNEIKISYKAIDKLIEQTKKYGVDVWFEKTQKYFLEEEKCEKCGCVNFKKGEDILDVWFDSGVSHIAVAEKRLTWPVDMYLEGSDQHRGWFQLSLIPSIALRKFLPFKEILTHGFVVDEEGRKMSKSLGNVVSPEDIISQHGADILRLWVVAEDYTVDVKIGQQIIKRIIDSYRKIRNTFRFLLGILNDYTPINEKKLDALDYWILKKLKLVEKRVHRAYENYEFHIVYNTLLNFIIIDLSAIYLEANKETLYVELKNNKKRVGVQFTSLIILKTLVKLLAPILVFTAEEVWQNLKLKDKEESIHLTEFENLEKLMIIENNYELVEKILKIREDILKAIEQARNEKLVKSSQEVEVYLQIKKQELLNIIKEFGIDNLRKLLVVSKIEIQSSIEDGFETDNIKIKIKKSESKKCQRCWFYFDITENVLGQDLCLRCAQIVRQIINK